MSRLLLILLLLPFPALAAYECPPAPWSDVTLDVNQDPYTVDTSVGLAQLQTMHPPAMVHQQGPGVTMGLAASQLSTSYKLKYQLATLPDGVTCASVVGVEAIFSFTNNTIYVAQELPNGSCIQREVLAHEKRHMATDLDVARDWHYRMQQDLYYAVKDIGTVRARDTEAARQTLQQRLEPLMSREIELMSRDRQQRQARVDSVYEYERLGRTCNGEGQQYVRAYLGR